MGLSKLPPLRRVRCSQGELAWREAGTGPATEGHAWEGRDRAATQTHPRPNSLTNRLPAAGG